MTARLGKAFLFCLEGIALVIALAAGAAFFIHWKMSHGGISLDLARPVVAKAFEQRLAEGSDVSVGNLYLQRDERGERTSGPIRLIAQDLRVAGPDGRNLLELPSLSFRLRTGDLIRGDMLPRYVEIQGATVSLTRQSSGQIDFGIIRPGAMAQGPRPASTADFFDSIFPGEGDAAPLFEGALLTDTNVTFTDRMTGTLWRASGAESELWQTSRGYRLRLDAPFEVDEDEAWLKVEAEIDDRAEAIMLDITVRAAPVSSIVTLIAGEEAGSLVDATLTGSISTVADYAGTIRRSAIDLSLDEGVLNAGDRQIDLERIDLVSDYQPEQRTFSIETLDYAIAGNEGTLTGFISLGAVEADAGLQPETIEFNLAASDLIVDLPGITPDALALARGDFAGRYDVTGRRLVFDELSADYFGQDLAGSLQILLPLEDGQSTGVIADAAIAGTLSPQEILRGWPLVLAQGARDWIRQQLPQGRISGIDFEMDMPRGAIAPGTPLANDMMTLDFAFSDTTAIFVPGMTPLTGARGSAVVRGNRFDLEVRDGAIGPVAVTGGGVEMPGFMPRGAPAYYRASVAGDIRDILNIVNEEPLGFLDKAGFGPERFSGQATFDFEIMRPQLSFVPAENYEYEGTGTFENVTITEVMAGQDINNASGTLQLSQAGLSVAGQAEIASLPVEYDWSRTFGEVPDIRLVASGLVDTSSSDDLSMMLRPFLRGTVPYRLEARQTGTRYDEITLGADLADARIALDMLNYTKAQGQGGSLEVALIPPDPAAETGRWTVNRFALDTEDLYLQAQASLLPGGELDEATIEKFFIRDRAELSATIAREGGENVINVEGAFANIDLFGDRLFGGTAEDDGSSPSLLPEDVRLSVQLDRLRLRSDVEVRGYDALVTRTGGLLTDVSMSGDFITYGGFVVTLDRDERNIGRELIVETDNLGQTAAGLFDIESIDGGSAAYRATLLSDGPVAGTLEASDFSLVDAPLIARLLSAGSLTGLSDLLSGQGVEFAEISADLQYQNGMLTIMDARATGPSLGISVEGDVDFSEDSFNLNGAVAPAYGVNSVLGNIPGLGELLVSREGEGVVAFSYYINGPVQGPTVTINALSMFTPGIFRRIFEPIRDGRPSTAELLEDAVEAAATRDAARGVKYAASEEQMEMLRDSLDIFRRELSRPENSVPEAPVVPATGKGPTGAE